ncbi:MAG: Aldehyde:ferredoxin oxidoreductase [Candidatus Alkanophagales archaeon MCA70_species_1]|nr:Aldehyde:ferredoxin oxidoreductase [Candidatus Alkanophaga volatiphilum]
MPYAGGYAGSILHVNLSSGGVRKEPLDTQLAKNFIGGFGRAVRRRGAAALSPENPVIIGAGPLIGTLAPGASRVVCTTKFPLTSAVGTASGSMNFASQLKYAGYDHLVITGAASKPAEDCR